MNQELMTLDFWQDTVIYEGKAFPVGTLACDALNVPADAIAKMNEQCEKINLLLGMLNAGQDASALFPMRYDYGACKKYSGEDRDRPEKSKIFEGGVGRWIQNRKTGIN